MSDGRLRSDRFRAWSVALLAMVAGCTAPEPPDRRSSRSWEIESDPTVVIGLTTDQPEAALSLVADATRLPDGSLVVANGGLESRLPVFSAAGSYVRTIGGLGDGPGEFRWITSVEIGPGDSLYVFDASLQRLTAIASDGRVRTTPFRVSGSAEGEALRVVSRLNADTWIGRGMDFPRMGGVGEILQDTIAVGLLDGRLEHFERLERLPALMSMTLEMDGRRLFGGVPFAPLPLQAAWGRCIFVAPADRSEISVYTASGRRVRGFQGPGVPRRVSDAHKEQWLADRLRQVDPSRRGAFRRAHDDVPWPAQLPYYTQMLTDQWGRLWLQEYSPPIGVGRRWYVLSQSGEYFGDVLLPAPMRVFEITEHGILGVMRNEFDEELVELLPLEWEPPAVGVSADCRDGSAVS